MQCICNMAKMCYNRVRGAVSAKLDEVRGSMPAVALKNDKRVRR